MGLMNIRRMMMESGPHEIPQYETAGPADIVTFESNWAMPMRSLKVGIDPVQDLHGYDNPWPAGGGKNIAKFASQILDNDRTQNGITFHALSENQVRISGIATGNAYMTNAQTYEQLVSEKRFYKAGTYTLSSNLPHNTNCAVYMTGNEADGTPISGNIVTGVYAGRSVSFTRETDFYANIQLVVVSGTDFTTPVDVWVQLETGSTATAYAPYSNICPISGRTGAQVQRTGKNLFDIEGFLKRDNITYEKDGSSFTFTPKQSMYSNPWRFAKKDSVISASVQSLTNITSSGIKLRFLNDSGTTVFTLNESTNSVKNIVASRIRVDWSTMGQTKITAPQIEFGAENTSYEPYSGNTYPISWQTEAGTVYGGTLDVVSGELVVDRASVDLGTLAWNKIDTASGHWRFWALLNTMLMGSTLLSSHYKSITATAQYLGEEGIASQKSGSNNLVMISDETYADVATFKSAMSGVMLVYELAESQTYHLTPTEVRTLLGQNNVWADTGDSVVTYPADTKLYIDKRIAEMLG